MVRAGATVHASAYDLRRRAVALAVACILLVVGLVVADTSRADAANGADFDPGFIISDATFFDSSAMTKQQIQSFLEVKVPTCFAGSGPTCLRHYTMTTSTKAADSYCGVYSGATNETAAAIIQKVATACGINPQVLLVLLQKEQGLITSTAPTDYKYRSATGYGCPDTAACDSAYYGFQNQVYNAARQFQRYTATSTSWSYQPGRTNQILYHPNAACGKKSVYIQNQATANLYIYTPYTPNSAALANMGGTGDSCSSYGNRNFFAYFTDWFGNPGNLFRSGSLEGGSSSGWGTRHGFINRAVYNAPTQAQTGNWFLATNTPVAGRELSQSIARSTSIGQLVTTTFWVRTSGSDFAGKATVSALGGTAEAAATSFTANGTWQQITVSLPIKRSGHTSLRFDLSLTTVGTTLWFDSAMMTVGQGPLDRNLLSYPSFEGAFTRWIPGNGFVNRQVFKDPRAQDGEWFAASNTSVAGRSFAQDFVVQTKANERYTFSIWLRSSNVTKPFSGKVALWALGGTKSIASVTNYTVSGEWTKVDVSVDVGSTGAKQLRVEVYMNTTGATLWLDNGSLTRNVLTAGSFEGASFGGWQRSVTGLNYAVYSKTATGIVPAHGSYFAAFNVPTAGTSLFQDVKLIPTMGQKYTADLWVKSGSPGKTLEGKLAIWSMGGTTEVVQKAFTATDEWTLVQVDVPITQNKLTGFRYEIYLGTTGATLHIDGAQLR